MLVYLLARVTKDGNKEDNMVLHNALVITIFCDVLYWSQTDMGIPTFRSYILQHTIMNIVY